MNCPTCEYEFDPTRSMQCPRCGETLDCSAASCDDCEACTGLLGTARRAVRTVREDGE